MESRDSFGRAESFPMDSIVTRASHDEGFARLFSSRETVYSIDDVDDNGMLVVQHQLPYKEVALAITLLALGTTGIIIGLFMIYHKIGGDRAHGIAFTCLGGLLFLPGFVYTRVAYYAYKGYRGYSFNAIPAV